MRVKKICWGLLCLSLIVLLAACGSQITPQSSTTPILPLSIPSQKATPKPTPWPHLPASPPPHPAPTSSVVPAPNPTAHFSTLPPGSVLPSDAQCTSEVRKAPENRPDNTPKNNVNEYANGYRPGNSLYLLNLYAPAIEARVSGNFTGTTDEILQWVACKWGIDEDIVRAQAQSESNWHQSQLGDSAPNTQPGLNGNSSVGILQVKGGDIPPTHPGTWPYAWDSTSWNADYSFAVRCACFEGKFTWLGNGYKAGDMWGCVGEWYSGQWYDSGNTASYIASVKNHLANKDWLKPGF